jgi:hypothetical protein
MQYGGCFFKECPEMPSSSVQSHNTEGLSVPYLSSGNPSDFGMNRVQIMTEIPTLLSDDSYGFPRSLQSHAWTVPSIMPQSPPSTFFPVRC